MAESRLSVSDVRAKVAESVNNTKVIDLHTHLFPPSHGSLCLWGPDELLVYHYLVSGAGGDRRVVG